NPASYIVCEIQQSPYIQSDPTNGDTGFGSCSNLGGAGPGGYAFTLSSGQSATGDFGNYQNASISGVKYEDANANGTKDGAESGPSVSFDIRVYKDNGSTPNVLDGSDTLASSTLTTSGTGAYSFSNLKPGNYLVCETQKSGWTQSQPDPSSSPVCGAPVTGNPSGGGYAFALTSNQSKTVGDLGNYQNASISGVKYEDANANGTKDGSESGPSVSFDIRVYKDNGSTPNVLDGTDTLVASPTTAVGTGAWSASGLKLGNYLVCEVQKSGWTQSQPDPSSSPVCGAPVTGNPSGGGYAFALTSNQSKTV